jgi:sedoheptulokinase
MAAEKILGIDLGTSKVAAVVIDSESRELLSHASIETFAQIKGGPQRSEQDVALIFNSVREALGALGEGLLAQVRGVGITGQMHGVVLWDGDTPELCSSLITWQDQRASEFDFLKQFRQKTGDSTLQDGYGFVSLAWLLAHEPDFVAKYNRATSLMDLFSARLCGDNRAVTDPTIGQSFGLFDLFTRNWDTDRLRWGEIPSEFIPELMPSRTVRGYTAKGNPFGLPEGLPVALPIGDNQAALIASLRRPEEEISLNLGTAGQLSVVLGVNPEIVFPVPAGLELRPFPGNRIAAVCASLCGGRVAQWFCDTLIDWCRELGGGALEPRDVYRRLNELGLASLEESTIEAETTFMGERHSPTRRGALRNIDLHNFTLGNVAAALSRDVVENLKGMMPDSYLKGRRVVVGSGNGIRRVPLMQSTVERVFGLPLVMSDSVEEAACGAAIHAIDTLQLN